MKNGLIENAGGDKYWYINGKLHQEDGPAVEYAGGDKYWYINGKEVTKDEWLQWLKDGNSSLSINEVTRLILEQS